MLTFAAIREYCTTACCVRAACEQSSWLWPLAWGHPPTDDPVETVVVGVPVGSVQVCVPSDSDSEVQSAHCCRVITR
jgi:hypothetical protein